MNQLDMWSGSSMLTDDLLMSLSAEEGDLSRTGENFAMNEYNSGINETFIVPETVPGSGDDAFQYFHSDSENMFMAPLRGKQEQPCVSEPVKLQLFPTSDILGGHSLNQYSDNEIFQNPLSRAATPLTFSAPATPFSAPPTPFSAPATPLPNVQEASGSDGACTNGRRGRKSNVSKGLVPIKQEKKMKKWQLNDKTDKTVLNAQAAKANREKKKEEFREMMIERDNFKEENETLKQSNAQLQVELNAERRKSQGLADELSKVKVICQNVVEGIGKVEEASRDDGNLPRDQSESPQLGMDFNIISYINNVL
jgi:hypothetical protein